MEWPQVIPLQFQFNQTSSGADNVLCQTLLRGEGVEGEGQGFVPQRDSEVLVPQRGKDAGQPETPAAQARDRLVVPFLP